MLRKYTNTFHSKYTLAWRGDLHGKTPERRFQLSYLTPNECKNGQKMGVEVKF
jgi:hypothetical protein